MYYVLYCILLYYVFYLYYVLSYPAAQRSPNASVDQLDETRETLHELDGDRVRSFG